MTSQVAEISAALHLEAFRAWPTCLSRVICRVWVDEKSSIKTAVVLDTGLTLSLATVNFAHAMGLTDEILAAGTQETLDPIGGAGISGRRLEVTLDLAAASVGPFVRLTNVPFLFTASTLPHGADVLVGQAGALAAVNFSQAAVEPMPVVRISQ